MYVYVYACKAYVGHLSKVKYVAAISREYFFHFHCHFSEIINGYIKSNASNKKSYKYRRYRV